MDLEWFWERIDQHSMQIKFDFCTKSNFQNLINFQSNLSILIKFRNLLAFVSYLDLKEGIKINFGINLDLYFIFEFNLYLNE